jgi:hypothetical protein
VSSVAPKLAGFAAVLNLAFGAAAVAGGAFGPEPDSQREDRLFLQLEHERRVQTVAFTQEVK